MTRHHPLAPTTRTVEMAQVDELNARLAEAAAPTAADLDLEGARLSTGDGTLPCGVVLNRVTWSGPPEFPDLHGVFGDRSAAAGSLVVDLHTAALRELSRRLGLRQTWGLGPSRSGH